MTTVWAIDVDNCESYSDHEHFMLKEVYANHRDAVDMLVGKGFKAISDTEFVWKPPVNDDGWPLQPYEVSYPFSFGYGLEKMQATIFACDVVK